MPVILPPGGHRGDRPRAPQRKIDDFWRKFTTKAPGKATTVLPKNEYAERVAKRNASKEVGGGRAAQASFEEAVAVCRAKVDQIVSECRRVNQKYRDPHFDLEYDLKSGRRDCLESLCNIKDDSSDSDSEPYPRPRPRSTRRRGQPGLDKPQGGKGGPGDFVAPGGGSGSAERADAGGPEPPSSPQGRVPGSKFSPKSVKRVGEIFDDPKFYIDGPTANDVRQGRDGDCWLMAALCTLSNKPGLIERICVAQNKDVGVYGFVFHRDGEWVSEIIDDKLYLTKPDYDEAVSEGIGINIERLLWEDRERPDSEEIYRKTYQSNSGALYFAQCENPNETWLPLLEKAYAKAHGDYAAIEGGFTGEGIEDLTGGVTSGLFTTDILDKEYFWKEELMQVNKQFLFGCSTGLWGRGWGDRKGIMEGHAYSVMKAVEMDGERLLLLKNPWGKGEWKGPWSDGSKEWTPEWLQKLGHRFGDDGAFWISFKDLLRKYQAFDRTRLFGPEWKITSIWTTLSVPWTLEYHDTKFAFTLSRAGPVVIVLSQLDDRYFRGLEGQYKFGLSFRVHKAGPHKPREDDYLVRTQSTYRMTRSVNVELDLDAGEYLVLVKLDARRLDYLMPVEDVVRDNAKDRREKLIRIGLAYDLAHSKAKISETPEEKTAREAYEKRKREKKRQSLRKAIMEEKHRVHYEHSQRLKKERKRVERTKARAKLRAEKAELQRKEAEKKRAERKETKKEESEKKELERRKELEKKEAEKQKVGNSQPASTPTDPSSEQAAGSQGGNSKPDTAAVQPETQPETESFTNGKQVKAEPSEPGTSTDAGEDTPSTTASNLSASLTSANEEKPSSVPEKGVEEESYETAQEEAFVSQDGDADDTDVTFHQDDKKEEAEASPRTNVDGESSEKPAKEEEPKTGAQLKEGTATKDDEKSQAGKEIKPEAVVEVAGGGAKIEVIEVPGVEVTDGPRTKAKKKAIKEALKQLQNGLYNIIYDNETEESAYDSSSGDESDGQGGGPSLHPHTPLPRMSPSRRPGGRGLQPQHHPQHHPLPLVPHGGMGGPWRGPPPQNNNIRIRNGPPMPHLAYSDSEFELAQPEESDDDLHSVTSVSEISERELDYHFQDSERRAGYINNGPPGNNNNNNNGGGGPPPGIRPAPPGRIGGARGDASDLDEEFAKDPWNAIAVLGLRVYYKVSEEEKDKKDIITLRVVRPNVYDLSDDDGDDKAKKKEKEGGGDAGGEQQEVGDEEAKVLDVDDSAKDATLDKDARKQVVDAGQESDEKAKVLDVDNTTLDNDARK
ncbi:calcium-dependent cysteine-type endopeptidase-like protein [Podospora didyma]|uniref:Calcium-dependent cysteine-type endopeptidase-like protein n=1 Tax=Podospora didyma TaxID=330526 RepID=A0AAE0KKG2_9PEZI|nr:calcium-dependent cysteine-type endopeptidase-like protein [Podospora didyma]